MRDRRWSAAMLVVLFCAGLMFSASAKTARGTDLRSGRRLRLAELVAQEARRVAELDAAARRVQADVEARSLEAADRDEGVRAERAGSQPDSLSAGLVPLAGPGVVVALDDAPRGASHRGNPSPDDLVVHEQDVLAVINALWAGGADGVAVMGHRLIATSAVRCVGNTLLLHGAVYSPPFTVAAIGDQRRLVHALDTAPGVQLFRGYVAAYGLGYSVRRSPTVRLAAYDGPLDFDHAQPR